MTLEITSRLTKNRLAHASPFLHEPLLQEFGQMALNHNADLVLAGEYECPPGVDKYTKRFLSFLAQDSALQGQPSNDLVISQDQLNSFWNKKNEKVVSSPSGRHIGTYKATAQHPSNSAIQARLTSLPYEIGKPLPRTTKCVNVSLLKKGKGITPKDLRTIWLMEADLNAGAKIHWVSRMMNETALSNNLIPESQYAKRGSKAIEAGIVKIIFFDQIRQKQATWNTVCIGPHAVLRQDGTPCLLSCLQTSRCSKTCYKMHVNSNTTHGTQGTNWLWRFRYCIW